MKESYSSLAPSNWEDQDLLHVHILPMNLHILKITKHTSVLFSVSNYVRFPMTIFIKSFKTCVTVLK